MANTAWGTIGALSEAIDDLQRIGESLETKAFSTFSVNPVTFTPNPVTINQVGDVNTTITGAINFSNSLSDYESNISNVESDLSGVDFPVIDPVDITGMPSVFAGVLPPFDATGEPTTAAPDPDTVIGPAPPAISTTGGPLDPVLTLPGTLTLLPPAVIPPAPMKGNIPAFSNTLPPFSGPGIPNANELTNFNISAAADPYTSALLELIEERITNDLSEGRLGIPEETEGLIWDRQLERDEIAYDNAIRKINEEFSLMGFGLPPGRRDVKIKDLAVARANTRSEASRDIAAKQAELTQAWQQIAIEQGVTIQKVQMDYVNRLVEISFNVAKESVNAGISIFNAYVSKYNTQVEAYKASASVYEIQVRTFMTEVEIFKAELEAAKIQNSIRKDDIEIYQAQIQTAEVQVKLYQAQLQAFIDKLNIQKLDYELYGEKVKTYQALVSAYSTEWQGYSAKLEGQKAIQTGFTAEVQAYKAAVDAYSAKMQAESTRVQAQATENTAKIEQYKAILARLSAYSDMLRAETTAYSTDINAEVQRTSMEYDLQKANIDLELKAQQLELEARKAVASIEMNNREMFAKVTEADYRTKSDALKAAGDVYRAITNAFAQIEFGQRTLT